MAAPLRVRSEPLRPLLALGAIQAGPAAYYGDLLRSADPIVAAGALCHLLEAGTVRAPLWDEVIAQCRHDAVRTRAFAFFELGFEHGWAARALAAPALPRDRAQAAAMAAELAFDHAALTEARGALYLATGDAAHLLAASESAELAGGWGAALPWALRALLVEPLNPLPLQRLYLVLDEAGQGALLEELAEVLLARNLHPMIAQVFIAAGALKRGQPTQVLARLKPLDDRRVLADTALAPYFGAIHLLRAQAEEKLGHYKSAYDGFLALKAAEKPANVEAENFYRGTAARGRLPIPPLPDDERGDVVQMLGFPRSGTTLLENVLAAHPAIETFEEVPALNAAIDRIERVLLGKVPRPERPEDPPLAARAKYYEEIDRRRRKAGATVLIDKLPIRSADAVLLNKLFADWRYIFSIRHPFDVALSCFKQRFAPNPAMENFRTIAGTARAYDHTMTQWFSQFGLVDPRVCYVRYDEVVTEFDATTARVLDFLGLPWDESVRDFAAAAGQRAARTPSYEKVRQGLSLGVQSSWRHYEFVFQSKDASPLRKWVEFFGYPSA
jgi:hypothetical protein